MGQAPAVREAESFQQDRVVGVADRAVLMELFPVVRCQACLHGLGDVLAMLVQWRGDGPLRSAPMLCAVRSSWLSKAIARRFMCKTCKEGDSTTMPGPVAPCS